MPDSETEEAGAKVAPFPAVGRLRELFAGNGVAERAPDWRDDLRLFALTWAIGFVFFLIVIA